MFRDVRLSRWLLLVAILAIAECATALVVTAPAQAQFFGEDRFPFFSRRSQRPQGGGFFDGFFGPSSRPSYQNQPAPPPQYQYQQQRSDDSRAPPSRKREAAEPGVPTTSIVVMGDAMADWLAYGMEDAFADSPEIAIVRKNKNHSGLLRYEAKGDLDWWHVARDLLASEKPSYVVMMLGVSDRQNIREKDLPKEPEPKAKNDADKAKTEQSAQNQSAPQKETNEDSEQQSVASPEQQRTKRGNGVIEFRTDQWAEIYSKRIDETIGALKSKGVPVFWVGLPSIRGAKSTADVVYLNDLYRARAQRAGVVYIDVWDGFVDEGGKFTSYGPDYEGQMRRLRSNDGVFFTKYGARKLAHYVEREIRRYMSNRATPVALPTGPVAPQPETKSATRPVAGPVVPLTMTSGNTDEQLIGASAAQAIHQDATANRVLVKGEPVPAPAGRADDFAWPQGTEGNAAAPQARAPAAPPASAAPAASRANAPASAAAPPQPAASDTVARREPAPAAPAEPAEKPKRTTPAAATAQAKVSKHKSAIESRPRLRSEIPRPPAPVQRSSDPLGWWR